MQRHVALRRTQAILIRSVESAIVYVNLKVPQNIIEISPRGNLKYPYDKS